MLRILVWCDGNWTGGAAQYSHELATGLARRGYELNYAHPAGDDPAVTFRRELGIVEHVFEYDMGSGRVFAMLDAKTPARILLAATPDFIVFSDTTVEATVAAKELAAAFGIPFLCVKHFATAASIDVMVARIEKRVEAVLAAAGAVVCVSDDTSRTIAARFGQRLVNLRTIHNARPDHYFEPQRPATRQRIRQEWAAGDETIVVLTVGEISKRKGYAYQVDLIQALANANLLGRFKFIWVGSGDASVGVLNNWISQNGLSDRVRMIGRRNDVADLLDAADVFLLPTEMEAMPLVVLEAMAKGVPVMASAVNGIPEAVADAGVLLPDPLKDRQGCVQAMASTLVSWMRDPAAMRRMGELGRTRAQKLFRQDRVLDSIVALIEELIFPPGDYVSPGFARIRLDRHFPFRILWDKSQPRWPYFRREIPHNFAVDGRSPAIWFLTRDEAHLLHNIGLQFAGKRALEIGCWFGWSTAHLAASGVMLDVIDPMMREPLWRDSVEASLRSAGLSNVQLHGAFSPDHVRHLAEAEGRKWSLFFIDGNHNAPGPLHDAEVCVRHAEPDAMMVFTNLSSPEVTEGLEFLRSQGWKTRIYDTMQIMGAAWRGDVQPIDHVPDPSVVWMRPEHLSGFG
jgi:glycosyltransferase involved in cell wall biosynthesis/predicted O-methyltransferase YrrM